MLELICKELGVEIGEEWGVEWLNGKNFSNYTKFKFTEVGLMGYRKDFGSWFTGDFLLSDLIYGKVKPTWTPKVGEITYIPDLFGGIKDDLYIKIWYNENNHRLWLERGLVFKTKDEAIECANKMLDAIK